MIRLIGCLMITGGCLGLGFWYRGQFQARLLHLRIMNSIMEMMMSEIRFSKATLPECCRRLSGRVDEPYRQAFLDIHLTMRENTGEEFGKVFEKRMRECLSPFPVQEAEKELFLRAASKSGFEDGQMQLRSIERSNEEMKDIIAGIEQGITQKSRMAMGLGAMSGLLLVVILL